MLATVAVLLALGAIYLARSVYNDRALAVLREDPLALNTRTQRAFALANAKLYWDEFYFKYLIYPYRDAAYWLAEQVDWRFWHDYAHERLLRDPFNAATHALTWRVDKPIIDRSFDGLGHAARRAASRLRRIQTGYVHIYAMSVLLGALLVMVLILLPLIRDWLGL